MAMVQGGARGETAAQIAKTMQFELSLPAKIHAAFAALQAGLTADAGSAGYQLNVANRLGGKPVTRS
jgi:serpin B